jgi:60 kDa SS-A/Ro ribonucleoprotein
VDCFVVITDGETWAGNQHSAQALEAYRQKSGLLAKLVVINMVANRTSIADPTDLGSLDVVGFDASVPALISDFVTGGTAATRQGEDSD